jgi:hypothetical protein
MPDLIRIHLPLRRFPREEGGPRQVRGDVQTAAPVADIRSREDLGLSRPANKRQGAPEKKGGRK